MGGDASSSSFAPTCVARPCLALLALLAVAVAAQAELQPYVVDGASLAVLDGETHTVVDHLPLLGGASDVAVSPDGETAYAVRWGQLTVLDLRARLIRAVRSIGGEEPPDERLRLSPAGDRICLFDAATYEHPSVRIFATAAGEFQPAIRLPFPRDPWSEGLLDAAFSPDGRRLYILMLVPDDAGTAAWLLEIDPIAGAVVRQTTAESGGDYWAGAAIVPERGVAYAGVADAVLVLDLASGRVLSRLPVRGPGLLLWDPDGERLFGWSFDSDVEPRHALFVIEPDSGHLRELARFPWWPRDVAVAPGGEVLYATVADPEPRAVILDAATGAVIAIVPLIEDAGALAFGPQPSGAPPPTATARPSPTPAAMRPYQAFAISAVAHLLSEIDTGTPAVVGQSSDPFWSELRDLVLAPGGDRLYGTLYGSVIAVDASSWKVVDEIQIDGAWNGLGDVAVSPDGATISVASRSTEGLWIIDPRTGSVRGRVELPGELGRQAFAPDGRRLYVTAHESTYDDRDAGYLHVVDPGAGRLLASIELPAGAADLAVSADGARIFVATGYAVAVVDTVAARVEAIVPGGDADTIVLSPDGGLAYTSGYHGWNEPPLLSVIDTGALRRVAAIPVAESGTGRRIVLTPDGQRALIAIDDRAGRVAVVDLGRLEVMGSLRVGAGPRALVVLPAAWTPPPTPTPRPRRTAGALRPCVMVPHSTGPLPADATITLIDPTTHGLAGSIRVGERTSQPGTEDVYDGMRAAAADPDGTLIYALVQPYSGGAGYLTAIDSATRAVVDRLYVGIDPGTLALSPDGSQAWVMTFGYAAGNGTTVTVVDLRAWRVLDDLALPQPFGWPEFSPDGSHVFIRHAGEVYDERVLSAIAASSREIDFEIPLSRKGRSWQGMAVLPDARTLLIDSNECGSADMIEVVDVVSRAVVGAIEVPVTSWSARMCGGLNFAVSPDGREVYHTSGASPGTVAVIDVAARRVTEHIAVETALSAPAFTPDGRYVYALSDQRGVAVIDATTRRLIGDIPLPTYGVGLVVAMIDGPCDALPASPTPTRSATPTTTPTRSTTPARSAAPTHSATPTHSTTPAGAPATPTAVATPTTAPREWLELRVGSASGEPGTTVAVDVQLAAREHRAAGVEIDVAFAPPVSVAARPDGRPACRVNPDIDKPSTAFAFRPVGCAPGECHGLRAVVVALGNVDPIPDGATLFTCDVAIAADAAAGTYPLRVASLGASDPNGNALPALAVDGTITVVPASSHVARASAADAGDGCTVSQASGRAWWTAFAAAPLLVARWWLRRRRGRREDGSGRTPMTTDSHLARHRQEPWFHHAKYLFQDGEEMSTDRRRSVPIGHLQSPGFRFLLIGSLLVLIGPLLANHAAALPPTAQEIVATGDVVDGFGRIGLPNFAVHGIDERGRLLVSGELSSGGWGLFWVGEGPGEQIWSNLAGPNVSLFDRIGVAGSGIAVTWGTSDWTLRRFAPQGMSVVAAPGGRTPDGATICRPDTEFRVSDAGIVAALASVAPPGVGCDAADAELLVVGTDGTPRHFRVDIDDGRILGVSDDGSVYFTHHGAVVAVRDGERRTIVPADSVAPSGAPLTELRGLRVSSGGAVAFEAREDGGAVGIYRALADRIERVATIGDVLPDGRTLASFDGPRLIDNRVAIDDAGDVAFEALWSEAGPAIITQGEGVLLARRGAPPQVVAVDAKLFGINAAGELAIYSERWGARIAAERWNGTEIEEILTGATALPGGAGLVTQGINRSPRLAADGRVGLWARRPDWHNALLCRDAAGTVAVVQDGDAAPDGGVFIAIGDLRFVDAERMLFFAARADPAGGPRRAGHAIYAATPDGIVRVLGAGSLTDRGARLHGFINMVPVGPIYAINRRGSLVAMADVDYRRALVRQLAGGGLETVELARGDGGAPVEQIYAAGIADDDTVVATVRLADGRPALLASNGGDARVVVEVDGATRFGVPVVHGDRILLPARVDGQWTWSFVDLSSGAREELPIPPDASTFPSRVRSVSRGGQVLFDAPLADGTPALFATDGRDVRLLATPGSPGEGNLLAINDRGNALWGIWETPFLTFRNSLHRDGPAPDAACFAPPSAEPRPLPTPAPGTNPCDTGGACASMRVGSASGLPGEPVTVSVDLDGGDLPVAGVQIDLVLPAALAGTGEYGRPPCRVNPDIGKQASAFAFVDADCGDAPGCRQMRALILALDNVDPIPNGATLFECDFSIAAGTAPGRYPIVATDPGGSTPDGISLPARGEDGWVDVLADGTRPANPGGGAGAAISDGCEVVPPSATAWPALALLALSLIACGWRGRR